MAEVWEYLEKMDEIVYVTDADTNEIVYLNEYCRKVVGVQDKQDYIGRKCHELLQGKEVPCEYCTNDKLKEGDFYNWFHTNEVFHRNVGVKDTLICKDGHRYRMEIAIDLDRKKTEDAEYFYSRTESVLIDCLGRAFSGEDPDESINQMLQYLGENFYSDRAYIFEIDDNGMMNNTYEWCNRAVMPQMDTLQEESAEEVVGWWLESFRRSELVIIEDLEEIRESHPTTYAGLKVQDIQSLVVAPVEEDGKLLGFFGLDNPDKYQITAVKSLLRVMGCFIASLLRQRNSKKHLEDLSYKDTLTGLYNRNAMFEQFADGRYAGKSIGIVFCDVTGLKQINDSLGHDEGDRLLKKCAGLLAEMTDSREIYRTGGDEFVILLKDASQDEFMQKAEEIKKAIRQSKHHMAVGYAWTDNPEDSFDELLAKADRIMNKDKRDYYARRYIEKGEDRRQLRERIKHEKKGDGSEFSRFLESTYCDLEVLCQSLTKSNSAFYMYFGDMQKNIFYVSDNMKENFGLQGNVIPDFLKIWEEKISHAEHLEMYRQDIEDMLQNKRTIHDLRYQVRDVKGNDIWIRCYGVLKWNEDKTAPLFFSGRVSCQDSDFLVDPLTNFLRDDAAIRRMAQLHAINETRTLVGFSLNSFTEINNTRGRAYGNRLIQLISNRLITHMSSKMLFYRLDGMNFLAMVNPELEYEIEEMIEEVRRLIEESYREMKLSVRNSCSFCVIDEKRKELKTEEILATVNTLIKAAKNDQEKGYVLYSEEAVKNAKIKSDMALVLSENVANDMRNFRIVIQPIVSTEDEQPAGGEVLLRWCFHGENVSPAVFVPILEKEKLIQTAGRWVFEQAVRACRRALAYNPDFYLSFNISFHQLSDEGFLDFMKATLEHYQVDGVHLVAELTETHFDDQPEELLKFVQGCRKLGLRVALDDFGNGYSSIRMLLQYPSDIVKLDRSLLTELAESKEKMRFIRSIVYACHQFDKKVCVEGVEELREKNLVIEAGCDTIQGFYYYRPLEIGSFYKIFRKNTNDK